MMMYDYDRSASSMHPEVAYRIENGEAVLSVLIDTLMAAYRKQTEDLGELDQLKDRLEKLSGSFDADTLFDKVEDELKAADWRFSTNLRDRDPNLSKRQRDRQKVRQKADAKVLSHWIRSVVVKLVEDAYRLHTTGHFKEPCITASYVREMLYQASGWDDHRETFKKLEPKQQLALCHYALESARKKGQLGSSIGMSMGRETRCYEPISW